MPALMSETWRNSQEDVITSSTDERLTGEPSLLKGRRLVREGRLGKVLHDSNSPGRYLTEKCSWSNSLAAYSTAWRSREGGITSRRKRSTEGRSSKEQS
jgi:hypothetical protein